jgi:hypothetical protein
MVNGLGPPVNFATLEKNGYDGSSRLCPRCGQPAKFQRWQAKRFVSLLGEVTLARGYPLGLPGFSHRPRGYETTS